MRLTLVRHGQTENNLGGLAQGWTDVELDKLGRRQAELVGERLKAIQFDAIFSSDLQRAVQTAQPLSDALGVPIQTTELLRERSLGTLEHAPLVDLRGAFEKEIRETGESRFRCRPCGVESAYDVMARIIEFTRLLPDDFTEIAIFTHGMTEETLMCHFIGAPVESSRSFSFDNGSVTTLRWDFDAWLIELYNDTSHLIGTV